MAQRGTCYGVPGGPQTTAVFSDSAGRGRMSGATGSRAVVRPFEKSTGSIGVLPVPLFCARVTPRRTAVGSRRDDDPSRPLCITSFRSKREFDNLAATRCTQRRQHKINLCCRNADH